MTTEDVLRLRPEITIEKAAKIAEAVNRRLVWIAEMRLAEVMAGPYKGGDPIG